jgi:hypothetical protein
MDLKDTQYLAARALAAAPHASPADRHAAIDAGALAGARLTAGRVRDHVHAESTDDSPPGGHITDGTARTADTVSRQHQHLDNPAPLDWSRFGAVIPILAASPGVGASVTAAVLVDALQIAGCSVLLVDTADPARSGLNRATRSDGPHSPGPHPAVSIRFSWRGQALLARAETSLPVLTPGMLPPPRFWRPGQRQIDVTIVDVGHDPWRVTAHPLAGAGAWLRPGTPSPRPILVVRPTIPSLAHAEQILARLDPWVRLRAAVPPAQLVVAGAKRWPPEVFGSAGHRTQNLLADALFLPHDPGVALHGITADVTPARLRSAAAELLRRWELLPHTEAHSRHKPRRSRTRQ